MFRIKEYPRAPEDCPLKEFTTDTHAGILWRGAASARAFIDRENLWWGLELNDSLEAYWARQHPDFEEMFAEECLKAERVGL